MKLMRMYDIIKKKRDGYSLNKKELEFVAFGAADGSIDDYQLTAFLMAVYFKGMNDEETAVFTGAMTKSGDCVDLSRFGELSVDKHSTGGVGDKTTLIVAPIVAALGAKVAKMSGRGLGHTGGTVDKLEAVSGYNTQMSSSDFLSQVEEIGIAVVGQTGNFAPADKKLYALRDVTATVDSIPLIASSIMSKKLAAGSHNIVLDVKCGSGAFMKSPEEAKLLAEKMVDIGKAHLRNISAVITDMNLPLGYAVGNLLEVKEAAEVLKGNQRGNLMDVCIQLATEMISLAFSISADEAKHRVIEVICSGKAYQKFLEWLTVQGGDVSLIDKPIDCESCEVLANQDGYISSMDAEEIGMASVMLGAGRQKAGDSIDYLAGIQFNVTLGDAVKKGDVIAKLYTSDNSLFYAAEKRLLNAITISKEAPKTTPLIIDIVKQNIYEVTN